MSRSTSSSLARWAVAIVALALGGAGSAPGEVAVESSPPGKRRESAAETRERPAFLASITVTATRGERAVDEVAATVTVIEAQEIERALLVDSAQLVRWIPGVYASRADPRYGAGGFNIRGVGGNRVRTTVDGIETLEEFEFGHFTVPAFGADLAAIDSVEILSGGASSLYGSDALGGVVSFQTRGPAALLGDRSLHLGARIAWDGATDGLGAGVSWAQRAGSWRFSLSADRRDASEVRNRGDVGEVGPARTLPDPLETDSTQLVAKAVVDLSPASSLELALESYDRTTRTELLSQHESLDLAAIIGFPPGVVYQVDKTSSTATDQQRRLRFSLEQNLQTDGPMGAILWRLFQQSGETEQRTRELRSTEFGGTFLGPVTESELERDGLLRFEQESFGGEIQFATPVGGAASPHLLTFGLTAGLDRFDQLRDRQERDTESDEPIPPTDGLAYPTKYFPESDVAELGAYVQAELDLGGGRVALVPGVRFDLYDLDADRNDPIYQAGNPDTPEPVDVTSSALSPRIGSVWSLGSGLSAHGQYSRGFRSPPYSAVNSGFTHFAGGITRLPNPDLEAETSDGVELGLRGSYRNGGFAVAAFRTDFDNFIELVALGFNPATGLIEFQHRNIARARISGLEFSGELALGPRWSARAAWAWIEGDDRTRDQPLNSIPPSELVVGLRHVGSGGRWGMEAVGRFSAGKSASRVDDTVIEPFRPPSFATADLTGWLELGDRLALQLGLFNLFDEKYWEWPAVLGRAEDDAGLDRYTSPGTTASAALQFRW
jgi:hemoglobin/transferrin/lactoferrin receptor protein